VLSYYSDFNHHEQYMLDKNVTIDKFRQSNYHWRE